LNLELTNGYRLADLRWNIAGDLYGTSPNIRSELTWSDLQVYQIERLDEILVNDVVFRMSVGYGWVTAGDNQDSDYNLDDRTDEFSRSYSDARGGFLFSGSAALGYRFRLWDGHLSLKPLLGLAYNQQAMVMTDGVTVIPPTGPVAGLNSRYVAHWGSMWTGACDRCRNCRMVEPGCYPCRPRCSLYRTGGLEPETRFRSSGQLYSSSNWHRGRGGDLPRYYNQSMVGPEMLLWNRVLGGGTRTRHNLQERWKLPRDPVERSCLAIHDCLDRPGAALLIRVDHP